MGSTSPVVGWTPQRLMIDRLGVTAAVEAVGVQRGALDIPEDPAEVGWWVGSAVPGDARGTVLIAGHVDTARAGKGALFQLERLPVGSTVDVRAGDRTFVYRTVARRSYSKQRLPKTLFARTGPAQLALVTCGGAFYHGAYDHNVVVYASPVGAG
jgi:sortase (surface protein transpeptidase)